MQLPQEFKAFSQPTLIIVTDNVQAKIFKALGHEVELVHTMSTKLEKIDQDRVAIVTSGGLRSGEQHEDNQQWTREQLYIELYKDLMHRHQNGEFEKLAFCAPQENVNELKESLHIDLLKLADVWVGKHLTNDDLADIVLHVQEEV